jgi:hypothetical protein
MTGIATIPTNLLYWGFLPGKSGHLDEATCRFRFERVLPVSVELVHTTQVPLPGGEVLIIGIEPERLRAHLATREDLSPAVWELVPDRLPGHLANMVSEPPLAQLNLLHGAFEPAPRRKLRLSAIAMMNIGLACAAAIAVIGSEHRVNALRAYADNIRGTSQQLLAATVPAGPGVSIRPELRLTMELRRLEQAARSPSINTVEIPIVLEHLWARWPSTLRVQAETVTATSERLVVRGIVPSLADAEMLARTLAVLDTPAGRYRAAPVQAQLGERGATFLLTWNHLSDGARP